MHAKKLLFVGYGKLAQLIAPKFVALGYHVTGIARSDHQPTNGVCYWQGAVSDHTIQEKIKKNVFDWVIVTLTPDGRDAAAYKSAYLDNIQVLLDIWRTIPKPERVFYISSTRVFGQDNGECVDETTVAIPKDVQGQVLLQSEAALLDSPVPATILRFSGIYGLERDYLLRAVKNGNMGDSTFTNRIHEDDGVAFIVYLCQRLNRGLDIESLYLVSDNRPEKSCVVRRWLAYQMGQLQDSLCEADEMSPSQNDGVVSGKRCSNRRLLDAGFTLSYPDYQAGYSAMLIDQTE